MIAFFPKQPLSYGSKTLEVVPPRNIVKIDTDVVYIIQLAMLRPDFHSIGSISRITITPLSIKAKNWNPGTPEISVYPTSI
jgi:hypothetical protein